MGRGRQKAKQQKIARKLKYLTTDTDYDELEKELKSQELGQGSFDPFASDSYYAHQDTDDEHSEPAHDDTHDDDPIVTEVQDADTSSDDDLDEYAKWAAEAAAKAGNGTSSHTASHTTVHHHIPMPVPSFLHKSSQSEA